MIDPGVLGRRRRGGDRRPEAENSLGRGLVLPDVNAILFDEAADVIDPHMKGVCVRS